MSKQQVNQLGARFQDLEQQHQSLLAQDKEIQRNLDDSYRSYKILQMQKNAKLQEVIEEENQLDSATKQYQKLVSQVENEKAVFNEINKMLDDYNEYTPSSSNINHGTYLQHNVEVVASNNTAIQKNLSTIESAKADSLQFAQEIKNYELQIREKNSKIIERNNQQMNITKEYQLLNQTKLNLINNMTLKQKSFVLQKAIERNNSEIIDLLADSDLDINFQNAHQESLLHTVIKYSFTKLLDKIIAEKPNLDLSDKDGNTPLHNATLELNNDIIERLLNARANPNLVNKQKSTALHEATKSSQINIIKLLLENMEDDSVNGVDLEGCNILHYAIHNNELMKLISPRMSTISILHSNNQGNTPLLMAKRSGDNKLVESLLNKINYGLVKAIKGNGISKVDQIVNLMSLEDFEDYTRGPSKFWIFEEDYTPLFSAAVSGYEEIISILLNKNPTWINITDYDRNTVLHWAVRGKKASETIKVLLEYATPELIKQNNSNGGITPLQCAILNKKIKAAKLLMKAYPELINIIDANGLTPLHYAAEIGNNELCNKMLNLNSELINSVSNSPDISGYGTTVLHCALISGNISLIEKVLSLINNALITVVAKNSYTALHYAAEKGLTEIVSKILDIRPDALNTPIPQGCYGYGYTPLHLAAKKGYYKICDLLVSIKPELLDINDKDGHKPSIDNRLKDIDNILCNEPNNVNIYLKKASLLRFLGRKEEVLECYEKGMENISSALQKIKEQIHYDINDLYIALKNNYINVIEAQINNYGPNSLYAYDLRGNKTLLYKIAKLSKENPSNDEFKTIKQAFLYCIENDLIPIDLIYSELQESPYYLRKLAKVFKTEYEMLYPDINLISNMFEQQAIESKILGCLEEALI